MKDCQPCLDMAYVCCSSAGVTSRINAMGSWQLPGTRKYAEYPSLLQIVVSAPSSTSKRDASRFPQLHEYIKGVKPQSHWVSCHIVWVMEGWRLRPFPFLTIDEIETKSRSNSLLISLTIHDLLGVSTRGLLQPIFGTRIHICWCVSVHHYIGDHIPN